MRIKGIKDLEDELAKKQDLYDKADNNPRLQVQLQKEINKIMYQLKLWNDLYGTVDEPRPTYQKKI